LAALAGVLLGSPDVVEPRAFSSRFDDDINRMTTFTVAEHLPSTRRDALINKMLRVNQPKSPDGAGRLAGQRRA
jgi:hypothetical protein